MECGIEWISISIRIIRINETGRQTFARHILLRIRKAFRCSTTCDYPYNIRQGRDRAVLGGHRQNGRFLGGSLVDYRTHFERALGFDTVPHQGVGRSNLKGLSRSGRLYECPGLVVCRRKKCVRKYKDFGAWSSYHIGNTRKSLWYDLEVQIKYIIYTRIHFVFILKSDQRYISKLINKLIK